MGIKKETVQVKSNTFYFNTQQNVAEILQVVLDRLDSVFLAAN